MLKYIKEGRNRRGQWESRFEGVCTWCASVAKKVQL